MSFNDLANVFIVQFNKYSKKFGENFFDLFVQKKIIAPE